MHTYTALMKKLGILDRLLTPAILLCMIAGVLIGNYVPGVQEAFDTARFQSVSARTYLPQHLQHPISKLTLPSRTQQSPRGSSS